MRIYMESTGGQLIGSITICMNASIIVECPCFSHSMYIHVYSQFYMQIACISKHLYTYVHIECTITLA